MGLLPDVHERFISYASELSQFLHEDVNTSKLVTSAYINSQFTAPRDIHMYNKSTLIIYQQNVDFDQP